MDEYGCDSNMGCNMDANDVGSWSKSTRGAAVLHTWSLIMIRNQSSISLNLSHRYLSMRCRYINDIE